MFLTAVTATGSKPLDLQCHLFKASTAVWAKEGLGPARTAFGCGLGPVTAWGSAEFALLYLFQNNNLLSSKEPRTALLSVVHLWVAGLGRIFIFGALTCSECLSSG